MVWVSLQHTRCILRWQCHSVSLKQNEHRYHKYRSQPAGAVCHERVSQSPKVRNPARQLLLLACKRRFCTAKLEPPCNFWARHQAPWSEVSAASLTFFTGLLMLRPSASSTPCRGPPWGVAARVRCDTHVHALDLSTIAG
jgi:hypothetical protein